MTKKQFKTRKKGGAPMTRHAVHIDYHDFYEYHGNTIIELIRQQGGVTIKRDWLLFDSGEDAQEFFNSTQEDLDRSVIH